MPPLLCVIHLAHVYTPFFFLAFCHRLRAGLSILPCPHCRLLPHPHTHRDLPHFTLEKHSFYISHQLQIAPISSSTHIPKHNLHPPLPPPSPPRTSHPSSNRISHHHVILATKHRPFPPSPLSLSNSHSHTFHPPFSNHPHTYPQHALSPHPHARNPSRRVAGAHRRPYRTAVAGAFLRPHRRSLLLSCCEEPQMKHVPFLC